MQKIIFSITLFSLISISINAYSQKNRFFAPFQGKKTFCSTEHHAEKALVSISGNQVTIVIGKKKIIGNYKSTKILLTNDPEEISYRKTAGKYHYGTYYVIQKDYLSILEPENGEYVYAYELCK